MSYPINVPYIVLSLSVLVSVCHAQQDCRYVTCGPPTCNNPVNIPGKCCPVCPPAAGSRAPNAARCPKVDITLPCVNQCGSDMDCPADQRCCDHGCGKSCRYTVTISSGSCPQGQPKPNTNCEKLSGTPCGVGYYCKHSLSGYTECCPTPDYAGYQNNHPCAAYICTPLTCTQSYIPQGECCPACRPEAQVPASAPPPQSSPYNMPPSQQYQQPPPPQQIQQQQQQQFQQQQPYPPQQQQLQYQQQQQQLRLQQQPQPPPDPCVHVQCPPVNCMFSVKPVGQCCHVCQNGAITAAPPPPAVTYAPSILDSMRCMFSFCQDVTCPNSYIPNGECCHVCPPDPCANAVCPALACPTSFKPDGQCCPICTVLPPRECFFKGQKYSSGQGFQNGCNNCTCTDGHIFCSNYTCEQPCRHNGNLYATGKTVYSTQCQTCTCGNGVIFCTEDICKTTLAATPRARSQTRAQTRAQTRVQTRAQTRAQTQSIPPDPCRAVTCSSAPCAVTYQPVGTCCPICLKPGECLFEGKVYVNGAVRVENCQKCSCQDGLMVCSNECFKRETTTTTTTPRPAPVWRQPVQQRPPNRQPAPTTIYQTEPVRQRPPQPPPQPSAQTPLKKRGPPPRPPPPGSNTAGPPGKPPLLVQSSLDLQVVQSPPLKQFQSKQQTFNGAPQPYDQPVSTYVNPPGNQLPPYQQQPAGPMEPAPYPDIQSTGNKPIRAEAYQTYPKVEVPNRRPLQAQNYPFEQLPPEHPIPTQRYPNIQSPSPKRSSVQSIYQPTRPISPTRYPPTVAQSGAGSPVQGRIISRNAGPKSTDEKCRMVNCPDPNCANYVIPVGECCAICKPKKKIVKKPGTCPPVRRVGLCVNFCKTDQECTGDEICCHNGCGTQCFPPVVK